MPRHVARRSLSSVLKVVHGPLLNVTRRAFGDHISPSWFVFRPASHPGMRRAAAVFVPSRTARMGWLLRGGAPHAALCLEPGCVQLCRLPQQVGPHRAHLQCRAFAFVYRASICFEYLIAGQVQ